jgi:hypothetical protein
VATASGEEKGDEVLCVTVLSVMKLFNIFKSDIEFAINPSLGHFIPSSSVNCSIMHCLQKKWPHLNKYGMLSLLLNEFLQH